MFWGSAKCAQLEVSGGGAVWGFGGCIWRTQYVTPLQLSYVPQIPKIYIAAGFTYLLLIIDLLKHSR